jgi:hypothetical protein
MRAFIIRPFGTKKEIDFDKVEAELINPALQKLKAEGRTTAEIRATGNIREDMFRLLLVADLVIADVSIHNANVFYELGIRHALRNKHTFMIRGKRRQTEKAATGARTKPEDPIPFDLQTDRYLEYDPDNPAKTLPDLIDGLRTTLGDERRDSPVFALLPGLEEQERSRFLVVHREFREEVELAARSRDAGMLGLLSFEAVGFPWESEGLRLVGRAQFKNKEFLGAKVTWERVRELVPDDIEANTLLGNIYFQLGDLIRSDQALQRVVDNPRADSSDNAEARGQHGRNKKHAWRESWRELPLEERRRKALSPLLREAQDHYFLAYQQDINTYYPGLCALALAVVLCQLARDMPDLWVDLFDTARDAEGALLEIEERRVQLTSTIELCLNAARTRGKADSWLELSEADLKLLSLARPGAVRAAYSKAAQRMDDFARESAARQLALYEELDLLKEGVAAALNALQPRAVPTSRTQKVDRLILFTGHRIDEPGRKPSRFPASCEDTARKAIRSAVEKEKELANGAMLGIAGGASGGDILFHEICQELGFPTYMYLPLPPDQYVLESVDPAGGNWIKRFHLILKRTPSVPVLSPIKELPKWLQAKQHYNIWQRNGLWLLHQALAAGANHLTLIALWNEEKGDGLGGTEHMVRIARERHARVVLLKTKELFGTS